MADCGTILVVDHDDATRLTATQVVVRLGYVVCAADNAELLFERLNGDTPAAAIVAVELRGAVSGLEVLRELHERFGSDLPVILVSGERTSAHDRTTGLMLGADDYLVKPLDPGELLARIRRSVRRTKPGNGNGARNGDDSLSPREREILILLASGKTQREISSALVISPKTVATHIQHVLTKLGVHSRAQAVGAAYRLGLVEPDVQAHALLAAVGSD